MVFFTTPELLEIGGIPLTTPYDKPRRIEALQYYRKVVDTFQLQMSLDEKVVSIQPASEQPGPFVVESRTSRGVTRVREARNVVLAMGYYDQPNMLNVPGEDLPHVSHFYNEAHPYYRQRVVIVGGKNSACEAALELYRSGAHVTMVHRGPGFGDSVKYWVKPDIENRVKEGSIAAHFNAQVVEIRSNEVVLDTGATLARGKRVAADRLSRRSRVHASNRRRDSRRYAGAEVRRRHLRDERARIVCGRRPGGGEADRHRVHRERALPRRADCEDDCRASIHLKVDSYAGRPGGVSDGSWPTTTVHGRTFQLVTSPSLT